MGIGQPPEKVIEGAILHHHDHDVLDPTELRARKRSVALGFERGDETTGASGESASRSHAAQESSTGETGILRRHGGTPEDRERGNWEAESVFGVAS
jgi:hypothetical protein